MKSKMADTTTRTVNKLSPAQNTPALQATIFFFFWALCTIVFLLLCVCHVINYWNKKNLKQMSLSLRQMPLFGTCTIVFLLLCVCRVINYWNKKPQANVTQPKPMIPWLSEIGSMETDQNLATARYRKKGVNIIKPGKISIGIETKKTSSDSYTDGKPYFFLLRKSLLVRLGV